jgi:hypothetical protein
MTRNPLELPPPKDAVQRIHTLARDLAYGALHDHWNTLVAFSDSQGVQWSNTRIKNYSSSKWEGERPSVDLLVSFGFLEIAPGRSQDNITSYRLTSKAFDLLGQAGPAEVYISHAAPDGAVALMLLSRLKASGIDAYVDLTEGASSRAFSEKQLRSRDTFLCIIGPGTLDTAHVQQDVLWAMETPDMRSLALWHEGLSPENGLPEDAAVANYLAQNSIIVRDSSARAYNQAVGEVLNRFGFSPA